MVHALAELAEALRSSPGWQAKAHIAVVRDVFGASDWLRGPGDDGAAVSVGSPSGRDVARSWRQWRTTLIARRSSRIPSVSSV